MLRSLLIIVSLLAAAALYKGSGPGGAAFGHTEYTFGPTPRDSVLTHSFPFVNEGDEPLVIFGTATSCHCVTVRKPSSPVAPGGTGEIVVTFDGSKSMRGRFQQFVRVTTSATGESVKLYIYGELL